MLRIRRTIKRFKETPLYRGTVGPPPDASSQARRAKEGVFEKGGLLVVVALAVLVIVVLPRFFYRVSNVVDAPVESVQAALFRHPLTGAAVYEAVAPPRVFAVMIDNHEEAWPLAGIDQAFLVVEAPVEAGIPRMLAFFSDDREVEQIGPVRSARPYYLDWVAELDALYAHVGGSNAALDKIASGGTFDLNQYWWGDFFWRANGNRYAPHNVFTSTQDLEGFYEMREQAGVAPTRLYDIWAFKDPKPSKIESRLRIDFWAPMYVVDWEYEGQTGQYVRSQFNEPHTVEGGARIVSDNVAVVLTDIKVIDNVGRRQIRTIGEGEGYVLQDGRVIEATWRKPSASERLKFYDRMTDEEIVMNAGVTWIEVVGSLDDIVIE